MIEEAQKETIGTYSLNFRLPKLTSGYKDREILCEKYLVIKLCNLMPVICQTTCSESGLLCRLAFHHFIRQNISLFQGYFQSKPLTCTKRSEILAGRGTNVSKQLKDNPTSYIMTPGRKTKIMLTV